MMGSQDSENGFCFWWALRLVWAIWQVLRAWQRPRELNSPFSCRLRRGVSRQH